MYHEGSGGNYWPSYEPLLRAELAKCFDFETLHGFLIELHPGMSVWFQILKCKIKKSITENIKCKILIDVCTIRSTSG